MIEIFGHQLYVEQRGPRDGDPVVFLHHGLGSVVSWKRQLDAFAAAGFRVIAYDRWGYGRSEARESFETNFLLHEADCAVALLDALGIGQAHLVGHSDGGTIALLMAAHFPQRVRRVVAVAAHVYVDPKMPAGLRLIDETARKPPVLQVLEREHGEKAIPLLDAWIRHWRECEASEISMMEELPSIAAPVFVIQGELDEHARPQHALDIAEHVQDGRVWLIPDVRHMPPHEVPHEFNRRVIAFLQGRGPDG